MGKDNKYSFLERIFSVKNSEKKTHKIWTIFGLRIKVKYQQECKRNFFEHIFSIKNSNKKKHKIITI